MKIEQIADAAVSSAVFSGIGLAVLGVAIFIMVKAAPFSVRKEIEEDHNTALAIIMAGVIIGVSLVISAAIHG